MYNNAVYANFISLTYLSLSTLTASAGSEPYDPVIRGICDDVMGPMVFKTVQARAKAEHGFFLPNIALQYHSIQKKLYQMENFKK
jgi:hypothetical protein